MRRNGSLFVLGEHESPPPELDTQTNTTCKVDFDVLSRVQKLERQALYLKKRVKRLEADLYVMKILVSQARDLLIEALKIIDYAPKRQVKILIEAALRKINEALPEEPKPGILKLEEVYNLVKQYGVNKAATILSKSRSWVFRMAKAYEVL